MNRRLIFIAALIVLAATTMQAQKLVVMAIGGDQPVLRQQTPTPDKVMTSKGDLLIYPLNHATLALRWSDLVIYVDPVGGAGRFQGLPKPSRIDHGHPR